MKGTKICLKWKSVNSDLLLKSNSKLTLQRYDHSKIRKKFNITESTFKVEGN